MSTTTLVFIFLVRD